MDDAYVKSLTKSEDIFEKDFLLILVDNRKNHGGRYSIRWIQNPAGVVEAIQHKSKTGEARSIFPDVVEIGPNQQQTGQAVTHLSFVIGFLQQAWKVWRPAHTDDEPLPSNGPNRLGDIQGNSGPRLRDRGLKVKFHGSKAPAKLVGNSNDWDTPFGVLLIAQKLLCSVASADFSVCNCYDDLLGNYKIQKHEIYNLRSKILESLRAGISEWHTDAANKNVICVAEYVWQLFQVYLLGKGPWRSTTRKVFAR